MSDFTAARTNMVDCQIHTSGVVASGVLQAFSSVPREKFVPAGLCGVAYGDGDIELGKGRFLLEPSLHARMIQATDPRPQDIVLDIGGATGYPAAVMSFLVSTVIALEEDPVFLDQAIKNWAELDIVNSAAVSGNLENGLPGQAPFDIIFINGAVAEVRPQLMGQLSDGGRLVAVVKKPDQAMGQATLVRRTGTAFSHYPLFEAGAHYLPGFGPKPAFRF